MKKSTVAMTIVILALVALNDASAEMVNIGTGQMERSELIALKARVEGRQTDIESAISTPLDHPERYGMVEMARAEFESLRDKVASRSANVDARLAEKAVQMVNIGTGEMPMDEFIALKNMVEGADIFKLDHLAAAHP